KFINKLKYLKEKIQIWTRLHKESLNSKKSILKAELVDLDGVIDKGEGSDADGHRRREVVRLIQEVEKVPNANMVKDFRPISLIGSLYKVIAKVLANPLVTVLDDIVDEIQSAFVTDRQILDGPFILNEIVHWCKNKKKQSMIFKVDFEKACDSVRWDFIDDILRRINMNKSNLMGISVDSNKVKHAVAKIDPETEKWLNAMNVEMQSMKDNEVWVLVELPPNGKIVGSKWLFKKKTDMDGNVHIYKARLMAKGFTQTLGIDYEETFSLVADIR
nr:cysteine-rich receptor-like protein kinase [Tanacetum cinerariifolium]